MERVITIDIFRGTSNTGNQKSGTFRNTESGKYGGGCLQPVTIRDLIRTALRMRPDKNTVGGNRISVTINPVPQSAVRRKLTRCLPKPYTFSSSKGFISSNVEYIDGTKILIQSQQNILSSWRKNG